MAVGNITNVIPASELPVMAEEEFLADTTVVTVDGSGKMKQITRPSMFNVIASIVQKGDKGDTGATGLTGVKGDKGDKGEKGDTGATGLTGATGATGAQGAQGYSGWTPVLTVVARSSDQVLQVVNWTNPNPSAPNKPSFPVYVSATGFTTNIAEAINIKGSQGLQGIQGIQGAAGTNGTNGTNGWSPIIILQEDPETNLVYFYLSTWVGGTGVPPTTIGYISESGITTDPVAGSDIGSLPLTISFSDITDKPTTLTGYGIVATTDDVDEGTTNKYFTETRVVETPLTGLSLTDTSDVVSTDNVVEAFGKLQAKEDARRNEAGQVKITYSDLTLTNFTANTYKTFNIVSATQTVVASPTTTYPRSTPNSYSGVFDSTRGSSPNGRLIENPIAGQLHGWRIQGSYSGKSVSGTAAEVLSLRIRNPVSGFVYVKAITLSNNLSSSTFADDLLTIADNDSIPSPNGYILEAATSMTDAGITIKIDAITRISYAFENFIP